MRSFDDETDMMRRESRTNMSATAVMNPVMMLEKTTNGDAGDDEDEAESEEGAENENEEQELEIQMVNSNSL